MRKPYLVQNGEFKNTDIENITGIDSLIKFNYMGSSEYEWGALPASLKRILWNNGKYSFFKTGIRNVLGEEVVVYCQELNFDNIKEMTEYISKNKYGYKEVCSMNEWFDKDANTKYNRKDSFWWDIENDFMLFFDKDNQIKKVEKAFGVMKSKNILKNN